MEEKRTKNLSLYFITFPCSDTASLLTCLTFTLASWLIPLAPTSAGVETGVSFAVRRIIPSFSWENKKSFLENGFGYCLIEDGKMSACAFSSGVSEDYVDIGVETAEECRGKGYGRLVTSAMVNETLRRGKVPVWGCDTRNEASKRLACSVGFEITGTHAWYKYET